MRYRGVVGYECGLCMVALVFVKKSHSNCAAVSVLRVNNITIWLTGVCVYIRSLIDYRQGLCVDSTRHSLFERINNLLKRKRVVYGQKAPFLSIT